MKIRMKYALLIPFGLVLTLSSGLAQDRIYRCGNEYTNTLPDAKARGCKLMEGGNVTVVQGTRPASSAGRTSPASSAAMRVGAGDQKSRDADARQIIESELKKAEARRAELLRDYNNGEPERRGDEARNPQKYQERVNEIKAAIARNESDIAGIRRELDRVAPATAAK